MKVLSITQSILGRTGLIFTFQKSGVQSRCRSHILEAIVPCQDVVIFVLSGTRL
jgi:hypothetical protein